MKKLIISLILAVLVPTTPALAATQTSPQNIRLSNVTLQPNTIDPNQGETTTISYCINGVSDITLGIYEVTSDTISQKIAILENKVNKYEGCYSTTWDGTYGLMNATGTAGEIVPDGQYFYGLHADGTSDLFILSDYESDWITVESYNRGPGTDDYNYDDDAPRIHINDVEIENRVFDPWNDEEAEISFTINRDAEVSLKIYDDGEKIATVSDDKQYDQGRHSIKWNGEDKNERLVDEGEYEFKLEANAGGFEDTETGIFKVEKSLDDDDDDDPATPRLKKVFATKDSFDPARNEKTYIVFQLTQEADVTVTTYDKDDEKLERIYDKSNLDAGTYAVEWDGDEVADEEGSYSYKVIATNSMGSDTETGTIKIEEDEKDNRKPNVYKDMVAIDDLPFDLDGGMEISFKLDLDAEVTVEIRAGNTIVDTVIQNQNMAEGSHSVRWDGDDADDGIYQYKIIAANFQGKDVEFGNFSVENASESRTGERCAGFEDVKENYKYCDAIEWAKAHGVFEGYNDGTFKPNSPINRAEALKTILEAMDIRILDSNGGSLGFSDVDSNDWYVDYLKTALALGIIQGYNDGTFKPGQSVLRAEALKIILEAGSAKDDISIPNRTSGQAYQDTPANSWYSPYTWFAKENDLSADDSYFYPGEKMTRAEMADMLYRYAQNVAY